MRKRVGSARRLMLKARFGMQEIGRLARGATRSRRPTLPLDQVQRRLELLLQAIYGRAIPIAPAERHDPDWIERVRKFLSPDPRARESIPSADGETIQLPIELMARDGAEAAVTRYRLLAIEQAERIIRGTAVHAPLSDPLERDLYLLREGVAVDAKIARSHPGMANALDAERRAALQRRPKLDILTRPERDVELLLRDVLSKDADHPGDNENSSGDAASSLEWARAMAAKIRQGRGSYRGLPPTSHWGTVRYAGPVSEDSSQDLPEETPQPPAGITPPSSSTGWNKTHSQNARAGIAQDQTTESSGKIRSADAPPDDGSDDSPRGDEGKDGSIAAPEDDTNTTRGPSTYLGPLPGGDPLALVDEEMLDGLPPAIPYDEWDSTAGRYVPRAVAVRLHETVEGDLAWSVDTLQRHAALVRQIRHHFERLRARRTLLGRQRAGDDLDIEACVNAIIDRRIGQTPDDRLYLDARPARRGLAISLLVDVSGSTEVRVTEQLRIVDLEKIALLLAGEALDALGDPYAVHAFAGKGAHNVKLTTIKDFNERSGETVRRRVAALEPGGFTRLGAAVRHATHQLARQSAGHRLLLILSDGRPNDTDQYQGSYGVEDSRQAIIEARASGVYPFCLTVDRDASEYLPRIFGSSGHQILQRPEQLPQALLNAVHGLIRRP